MSQSVRLQKFIAECGVTSRRKAEELILDGKVKLNGQVVRELGTKMDPNEDALEVNGQSLSKDGIQKVYYVVNKPRCYMSTVFDPEGRPTVLDLCKDVTERIYPVGRLDYLSEGLLILTNDGELTNKILHPSFNIEKVYEVKVFGVVTPKILGELKKEQLFPEGKVKPQSVRVIKHLHNKTWIEFRLNEGRNREIRRLCESVGLTVDKLKRIAIESLTVDGIAPGKYRRLSRSQLLHALNMNKKGEKLGGKKFLSPKKTIKFKQKFIQGKTAANSKDFEIYRKEAYYETIKKQKEIAESISEKDQLSQDMTLRFSKASDTNSIENSMA